jgi:histidinol-phosphate aminotransferase
MSAHDPLVPPHVERLRPYVPGKPLEELEREFGIRDAIKLASNENPLGASPRALEAAHAALREGHRYPDNYKLRAALAAHHAVALDEITLGNGSNELIDLIARTFGVPGAEVVYPDPSFVCYRSSTIASDMKSVEVSLRDHVHYDLDAMLAALTPDTKLFYLANPNNPTGAYLGGQALVQLLGALPRETIVVLDEAYVEFADAPDFVSGLSLRERHPRLIVLRTFSKAYGLAAFRVGYAIAQAKLVDYLDRVRAPFNVSSIGLAAAQAALGDQAHLARYVAHNRRERARVSEGLSALGAEVAPSQANFVLARLPGYPGGGKALVDALLMRGVITRPMPPPIADYTRITIGTEAENDRLLATVRELLETRGS